MSSLQKIAEKLNSLLASSRKLSNVATVNDRIVFTYDGLQYECASASRRVNTRTIRNR